MPILTMRAYLIRIHQEFHYHLCQPGGNDVCFCYDINYVHDWIEKSGINMETSIPRASASDHNDFLGFTDQASNTVIQPSVSAEFGPSKVVGKLDPPNIYRRRNRQPCGICQNWNHSIEGCPMRGKEITPIYMCQAIAKYNATHSNIKPDLNFINSDSPLRRATQAPFKPRVASAIENDNDNFVDAIEYISDDASHEDNENLAHAEDTSITLCTGAAILQDSEVSPAASSPQYYAPSVSMASDSDATAEY